ncbi:MAG: type IV pilus assembly protein PilM [Planctomycetota bacterium]|jgi:type IV pilus assembly protein PilM
MGIFSKQIYPLEPGAFGLDISDLSVRAVQLERTSGEIRLVSYSEKTLPSGVIEGGHIKQAPVLTNAISEVLKNAHGRPIKINYVVASLPEQGAFVNVFELPKGGEENLVQTIRWELEGNIPLSPDEVYFDWQLVDSSQGRTPHKDVLVSVFKQLKLKIKALEIESLALARAILPQGKALKPTLILDLGIHQTGFVIFSGREVRFTTALPISGAALNEAIAKELNVDPKEAEALKLKFGLDRKKEEGRLFRAQLGQIQLLIQQLRKYLEFYKTHNPHEHGSVHSIQKVLLSGGGANLKGLAAHLSMELRMPVEIANPWTNILKPPYRNLPDLPFDESLSYTTALGLALRGLSS